MKTIVQIIFFIVCCIVVSVHSRPAPMGEGLDIVLHSGLRDHPVTNVRKHRRHAELRINQALRHHYNHVRRMRRLQKLLQELKNKSSYSVKDLMAYRRFLRLYRLHQRRGA